MSRGFDDVISKLHNTSKSVKKKETKKRIKANDKIVPDDSINLNTENIQDNHSVSINKENIIDSVPANLSVGIDTEIADVDEHMLRTTVDTSMLLQRKSKLTVEQTHRRTTVLIRNELLDRLEALAQGRKKGFKTEVFNTALQVILDDLERQLAVK